MIWCEKEALQTFKQTDFFQGQLIAGFLRRPKQVRNGVLKVLRRLGLDIGFTKSGHQLGADVHLGDTVLNGLLDILFRRAGGNQAGDNHAV